MRIDEKGEFAKHLDFTHVKCLHLIFFPRWQRIQLRYADLFPLYSSLHSVCVFVCSCECVFADVSFFSGAVMNALNRYGGQRRAKRKIIIIIKKNLLILRKACVGI